MDQNGVTNDIKQESDIVELKLSLTNKRKDWNCFNTRHSCTSCGKYIDTYRSC